LPADSVVVSQGGTIYGDTGSPGGIGSNAQANGEVDVYAPGTGGDVVPEVRFTRGVFGPVTMAFDPSGDLWVANNNSSTLVELTKAQLATANPRPNVTISAPSLALETPYGMAFDRSGDLWVVSYADDSVYEYTKTELTRSGSPKPRTTISIGLASPVGDAFDSSGDLWVANGSSDVVEFSRAELTKRIPTPTLTISTGGGANLVFTASGDLWVSWAESSELVEFTRDELRRSGSPAPAVTISAAIVAGRATLADPYGITLDSSGDLWASNWGNNTTVEFTRAELAKSGSPIPVRTIAGPKTRMNWPSFVVIEP
jgi:streptogramin lyase